MTEEPSGQIGEAPDCQSGPRVLVVDSGVGALSIARAIRERLPGATVNCVIDSAWFPYGEKEPALLDERLLGLLSPLLAELAPDVVVIGCNTASTRVLPHLRAAIEIPIVGVVPAIKPAAAKSRSRVIGLLATPATAASGYVDDLIAEFAADCQVVRVGAPALVALAEERLRTGRVSLGEIRAALESLLSDAHFSELDKLVLGCTHFPLLRAELRQVLPDRIELVDSEAAIARRVERLTVGKCGQSRPGTLFFTGDAIGAAAALAGIAELAPGMLGEAVAIGIA